MYRSTISAIIVDDEKPSREVLSCYIQEYCPGITIVSECHSVDSAFEAITRFKPQLVFLDVELPKGNGFDLLKMFPKIDFNVIFTTAFSEYAIQAFRYSAIDYLLKPIKINELTEAVKRMEQHLPTENPSPNLKTLLENVQSRDESSKKLIVADSKGFKVVKTSDIILCEADGYCTHFHISGRCLLSSTHNLKYYEELLPSSNFMRIHNSYLVNLHHVTGYSNTEEILLAENLKCPLSHSNKKSFLALFKQYK
jgi:two-component system, LytTR family, response regulator